MNESAIIVQLLWNLYNVLGDDGVSYSDYVECSASEHMRHKRGEKK
jgi:hypothetical protein